jgi:glutamyl-tRNA synthetase
MVTPVKTRFCPSPTGYMHLGNARTALFNALLAKRRKGTFLLRIEDTDAIRSKKEYVEALKQDLLWLGFNWQEGPDHDLNHGPYFQSERQTIYDNYYQLLERQGNAYPCFCTEEELALMRRLQRAAGKPPRYPGTCRKLRAEEITQKRKEGLTPTLRFHVPTDQLIEFTDTVKGLQRFSSHDIGDFIIRRADGTSPFLFCNAIDDAQMGVTHVLRGEDHLTNTPRQIMLLQALNLKVPIYGHISLILESDASKLSKRQSSCSIQELRHSGFFREAINNYIARLGHYYEEDSYKTLDELAEKFELENLGRSPARFDYQHLLRWQQEVISQKSPQGLWEWMNAETRRLVPKERQDAFIILVKPNILFPKDAEKYAKIFFSSLHTCLHLPKEQTTILRAAGPDFFQVAISAVKENKQAFDAISDCLRDKLKLRGKALFQPLRVALTGELHGPELAAIFKLLPTDEIILRLTSARDYGTCTK